MDIRSRWTRLAFAIVSIVTFLSFMDTTLLLPVMSLYASGVGASVSIAGLVIGLYSITNTPANIFFGRLIDKFGYRLPLFIGLVGDTIAIFLYSLASNPWQLALVRAGHGISGALIGPATMFAITDLSNSANRGKSMSVYGMSLAFATLIGFAISGSVVSRWNYDTLFYTGSGLLLVAVVLSLFLPRSAMRHGAVEVAAINSRTNVKSLLGRKPLITAYVSIFAQYFTFGGVVTLLPLHARAFNLEAFHIGMMLAAFAITFILTQYPSGVLSDKFGRLVPTACGLSLGTIALLVLPQFNTFPLLAGTMAVYGIAYGLIFPSVSAMVADNTEQHERGVGMGIFHAMLTAGVAIGAPVMGWVGEMVGLKNGLMLVPAAFIIALVLAVTLRQRKYRANPS